MAQKLHFKASTNVKSLVGKDLVTDEVAAVFELVKNSYDADATEVEIDFYNILEGSGKIIISDNGTGMSLQEIEEKWMVIGTDSKKDKGSSDIFNRPLNGDKGIGRFSVDRLGSFLNLYSVKRGTKKKVEMEFDWKLFDDDFKNLEDIPFSYSQSATQEKDGVTLEISELRDKWSFKKIESLKKNLKHFKSPFPVNDNFKIILNAPEFGINKIEIEPYDFSDLSPLWIKTEISKDDTTKINYTVTRDGIEYHEEYENTYGFGPIYSEVYFFDRGSKISFQKKMDMRVREFGNVRLYRDDFRIHPYGEHNNDWLELDRRKAQGSSRFFGTRDLIGFVQISKAFNPKIEVLTNRQGLKENDYFFELKDFLKDYALKPLEKYFFKKGNNESFKKAKENVNTAVLELNKVAKNVQKTDPDTAKMLRQISGLVKKSQSDQLEFVKNQEELLKVYQRAAGREILLHKIIHEGLIRIERVKTVASSVRRKIRKERESSTDLLSSINENLNKINLLADDAKEYLKTARDHIIRKREAEKINVPDFTENYLFNFQDQFNSHDISVTMDIEGNIFYKIDKEDLKTIFNNFISNSIKSLKQVDRKRELHIKIFQTKKFLILLFKDNGIGIPKHLRDRIFDPFFSTTEGFGIGLSIVDEIVGEYSGELNLGMNTEVGVEFQVKLRK
ncbi:ATP-binding protein [Rossellomorea aquimaris]|uniref:ATP-binding protein n=1 Tax=Rossellomorea aquimaris TaxID=189382 RepID=UPI001CD27E71|nr:sensor histidine kinase [Rossellomorea aquimaris]MCA1056969.1 ATP-binding protein [Rossellomorea aquimaris]